MRRGYSSQPNPEETDDQKRQREQFEERRRQRQKQHQESQEENIAPGTSPWARFMDVLKSEYLKSQAMQVCFSTIITCSSFFSYVLKKTNKPKLNNLT